jgi:hypothetical protein
MTDELVSKKLELLAAQRAKVDCIQELLNGGQPCNKDKECMIYPLF